MAIHTRPHQISSDLRGRIQCWGRGPRGNTAYYSFFLNFDNRILRSPIGIQVIYIDHHSSFCLNN